MVLRLFWVRLGREIDRWIGEAEGGWDEISREGKGGGGVEGGLFRAREIREGGVFVEARRGGVGGR